MSAASDSVGRRGLTRLKAQQRRCTVKRAALALAALSVAAVAPAQQTPSHTAAQPPLTLSASKQKTTPPPRLSKADKQNLVASCLRQVQANNPNVPGENIRAYCDEALQSYSTRAN